MDYVKEHKRDHERIDTSVREAIKDSAIRNEKELNDQTVIITKRMDASDQAAKDREVAFRWKLGLLVGFVYLAVNIAAKKLGWL